jgi:hypothetical protein
MKRIKASSWPLDLQVDRKIPNMTPKDSGTKWHLYVWSRPELSHRRRTQARDAPELYAFRSPSERLLRSALDLMPEQRLTFVPKSHITYVKDRLCSLVVRAPGYIPGVTRFYEMYWVWNGVHPVL